MKKTLTRLLIAGLTAAAMACSDGNVPNDAAARQRKEIEMRIGNLPEGELRAIFADSLQRHDALTKVVAGRYLGTKCRNRSNFQEANRVHQDALDMAHRLSDTLEIIRLLNCIGTNFRRIGALTEASEYHNMALNLSMNSRSLDSIQAQKVRTHALNGIGNISITMGYTGDALRCFSEALKIERKLGSTLGMAMNYANIGAIYEERLDYDSALVFYRKSMECNEKIGSQIGLSLCHTYMGNIYEHKHLYDDALNEYLMSWDVIQGSDDSWHKLVSISALAKFFLHRADNKMALKYIDMARATADRIDAIEYRREVADLLMQYHKLTGNTDEALKYLEQKNALNDSIMSERNANLYMDMRYRYERAQSTQELDRLNEANRSMRNSKFYITVAALLMLLLLTATVVMLHRYLRLMKRQNAELIQSNALKDDMFVVLSGNLKTPAAEQLDLLTDIAAAGTLTPDSRAGRDLAQAIDLTRKQAGILDDLLKWAQLRSHRTAPSRTTVDIAQIINAVVDGNHTEILAKRLIVDIRTGNDCTVTADPEMCEYIIRSLVSNSLKSISRGGIIGISTRVHERMLAVSVQDNGKGMSAEEIEKAFDVRSNTSDDRLSLPICKEMVACNGGTISISSGLHRGTHITFELPKA